jgi:hypothetical protein
VAFDLANSAKSQEGCLGKPGKAASAKAGLKGPILPGGSCFCSFEEAGVNWAAAAAGRATADGGQRTTNLGNYGDDWESGEGSRRSGEERGLGEGKCASVGPKRAAENGKGRGRKGLEWKIGTRMNGNDPFCTSFGK